MKKLLLIPTMIFPYLFCSIFIGWFAGQTFTSDSTKIFAILSAICLFFSFFFNIIFIVFNIKTPAKLVLKISLIIKIIHIPTYIIFFIFGCCLGLVFFMAIPLIILFVVVDYITLFLSSSISVYGCIKNINTNKKATIITLICQFIFCADVISLIVLNIKNRKIN